MSFNPVTALRRYRAAEEGAAAIEFSIVALVFVMISLGIVEFGRALYVRNELAYAVDHGARIVLMDGEATEDAVRTAIAGSFSGFDPDALTVTLTDETENGVNFRAVVASYPHNLLIPGLAHSLTLTVERRTPAT